MEWVIVRHQTKEICDKLTYCTENTKSIECKICRKRANVMSPVKYSTSSTKNAFVILQKVATARIAKGICNQLEMSRWKKD